MALWDEVKKNLVEWYTLTSDKTTEAARIGSRRWDKFGISRDIERQFSELGSLVYVGLKDENADVLQSDSVVELVQRIETLELELASKGEEIDDIRAEYAKAAASGGEDQVVQPNAEQGDPVTETVITDPVLEVGTEDSAILVEPSIEVDEDVVIDSEDEDENKPKE